MTPLDEPGSAEVDVKRRDLLRAAGAATALSFLPRGAEAAWARVLAGYRATGLSPAQRTLVAGIADVLLPSTDTPGAADAGVTDWVDLIVAEYLSESDRTPFLSGLDAIDAQVRASRGRPFAELDAPGRQQIVATLDASTDRRSLEARAYRRLKSLVVHGYFTSERVQRDVLHTQVFFDRFQGAADMPARRS